MWLSDILLLYHAPRIPKIANGAGRVVSCHACACTWLDQLGMSRNLRASQQRDMVIVAGSGLIAHWAVRDTGG